MAAMTLTSCVKDQLYDTPHPDTGALTITTDWSARSNEASVPVSYTLMIADAKQVVSGETNRFEHLLNPGIHNLTVYNVPEGMSLNGTVISVDLTADNAVESMPGVLFIANRQFDIKADSEITLAVPMKQMTRRLELVLTVQQGQYDRVEEINGTLSGVYGAVDILTGKLLSNSMNTTSEVEQHDNKFITTYNLLGIDPEEKQTLSIDLKYSNGDTETIESDLSNILSDYDKEITTLKVTGDLFLPLEGGFSGVISGWEVANGGNSDAH